MCVNKSCWLHCSTCSAMYVNAVFFAGGDIHAMVIPVNEKKVIPGSVGNFFFIPRLASGSLPPN